MVRRRIRHRPRRFSRNFIVSQLKKRNLYRSIVRQVQRDPDCAHTLAFDVPATIRPGTTVTAYNKRFRMLHRGTVLFHDPPKKGYVIQFERKGFGHEFCPDTEVATQGISDIVFHAKESPLRGATFGAMCDPLSNMGTLPYGSSRCLDPSKFLSWIFLFFILFQTNALFSS